METLFAYVCLWCYGFGFEKEYNKQLDLLLSQNPDNELLQELKTCSDNNKQSFCRL